LTFYKIKNFIINNKKCVNLRLILNRKKNLKISKINKKNLRLEMPALLTTPASQSLQFLQSNFLPEKDLIFKLLKILQINNNYNNEFFLLSTLLKNLQNKLSIEKTFIVKNNSLISSYNNFNIENNEEIEKFLLNLKSKPNFKLLFFKKLLLFKNFFFFLKIK